MNYTETKKIVKGFSLTILSFFPYSVFQRFAGEGFPERPDGFLIGNTVGRIVLFRFCHIPEEVHAEMPVKTIILDISAHMRHIMRPLLAKLRSHL